MEYIDVIDELGSVTGEIVTRDQAHQKGLFHRASHMWIFRKKNGKYQVLLQERSATSEVFPSCFDISSAGHVLAGENYEQAAIREIKEELGLDICNSDLQMVGYRKIIWDGTSHGLPYHDRHISKIFILFKDVDENEFHIDTNEVEFLKWMDWKDCIQGVQNNTIVHDIEMEEIEMLEAYLNR